MKSVWHDLHWLFLPLLDFTAGDHHILQVQNGIGLYVTWTTVATLLNFPVALQHNAGMSKYDAATVALVLLLVEVILW